MNVAADFFKKESRSPRGFLPRPLLRAGESAAPPPSPYRSGTPFGYFVSLCSQNPSKGLAKVSHTFSPQKNSGGAHHFRFRFLDLCIRFGKMISKACPVGSRGLSFGVCEGFNSGAKKLDTNSFFEDESVRSPSPANGGAGLRSATAPPSLWREMKRILMLSGEFNFFFLKTNNIKL